MNRRLAIDCPISPYLYERPGVPSELLRKEEARTLAHLIDQAHMEGRKFIGWPKIEMVGSLTDVYSTAAFPTIRLRVSVDTVPL